MQEVKELWTETLRNASEKTSNRLRAGELLAKSAGEFAKPDRPKHKDGDDDPDPLPEGETALICLPWNGRQAINAMENENGEITPFPGAEDDDVLIYLSHDVAEAALAGRHKSAKIPEV